MAAAETQVRVTVEDVSPHLMELHRSIRERARNRVEDAIAKPAAEFTVALQDALRPIAGHRCDLLITDLIEALLQDLRPIARDHAEQASMRALLAHLATAPEQPR